MSLLIKCQNCNNLLILRENEIKDKLEFYHSKNSIIKKSEYNEDDICGKLLKLKIKDNKYLIEII
jgi:DNA-directed RNA polymerase subunit M/transcription elongation factor TFIIS